MAKKPAPPKRATKPRARPPDTEREEDRVKDWFSKIRAADKLYEDWEQRFAVKQGEDYFEGRQWYGISEDDAKGKYVINLTLAAVETQKPSLLFYNPQVRIEPRPTRKDQLNAQVLQQEAKLSQQAVQTFVDDPDVKFMDETGLSVQEAHFRFAVVEVGYTADYIDNPHAGKPLLPAKPNEAGELPDDAEQETDTDAEDAAEAMTGAQGPIQPARITKPGTERIYVRRIPAHAFRVSLSGKNDLTANDWVGYYEWVYVSDLKANRKYRNTEDLKPTGTINPRYRDAVPGKDLESKHGMVKVWKLWDVRGRVKHVLAEGHQKFLLEDDPWKVFPFADLKFIERVNHYYPIPVVYNWLSPQDELNEQREQAKTMRRRSQRRYAARQGAIDDTELEKLQSGPDGVTVWEKSDNSIRPLQDGAVDATIWRSAATAEQDFTMVSGVSGEQRQVAAADTATQASIMDARARLRESSARLKVATWLARIARLMLLNLREHMALPFLVKTKLDMQTATPEEAVQAILLWQAITAKDLGSVDMDVTVDLASMSPVAQDAERIAWNQVLALLSNQTILLLLTQSETLMRKTLALYGIQSEHEIQEITKVATVMVQMAMLSGAAAGGGAAAMPAGPSTMASRAPGTQPSTQLLAQVENLQ